MASVGGRLKDTPCEARWLLVDGCEWLFVNGYLLLGMSLCDDLR